MLNNFLTYKYKTDIISVIVEGNKKNKIMNAINNINELTIAVQGGRGPPDSKKEPFLQVNVIF